MSVFRLTHKISCGLLCFVHLNLSRFIHCLIIKVHSSSLLSQFLLFLRQLVYFITSLSLCQQLFYFIFWCFLHRVVFSNLFIISYHSYFVNNFFIFWCFSISYCCISATRLCYHKLFCLSITFFIFFYFYFKMSGEGGIWTLAPLLTTCTLSRGVPSASLGTSPNRIDKNKIHIVNLIWAKK